MEKITTKLPDFYSVRNKEQIDYGFSGMEGKKCFLFLDNGFTSSFIETNKRDIRYIWDGFLLFVDKNITLDTIKEGIDLHDQRILALQRTGFLEKANNTKIKEYIMQKIKEMDIDYEIMPDTNQILGGYPSKGDMWSTRDNTVLKDAIETIKDGNCYFYELPEFNYSINFSTTKIPGFCYNHKSAIVLRNSSEEIIIRLLNDELSNEIKTTLSDSKIRRRDYPDELIPGGNIDLLKPTETKPTINDGEQR